MKKTMRFLSLIALALVGAVIAGCSRESMEEFQQPDVEILSTTIVMEGAQTRALTSSGVKTFAAGEQLALVYKNSSGTTVKAVSAPLPEGEYGKSARFTFELVSPDKTKSVTYIYPAVMANADGSINYGALASQDGMLASLAGNLDLCTQTAAWNGEELPTGTLVNQLAICAYTLKNYNGTSDLTSSITGMTVSDGTNTYTVSRAAAAGPIYVAIRPTASANIEITATDGTHNYVKSLTGKTYAAGNGYGISLRMQQQISYTAPTLRTGLRYNGGSQSLVNAGTVDGGTISYSTDGGASWSGDATGQNPGSYTVYYKIEPAAGYTGGVGPTLLGNVTMNKGDGWINYTMSEQYWGTNHPNVTITITSSHGGAISVHPSGTATYEYNGGNTIVLHGGAGADNVTITCAATDYYEAKSKLVIWWTASN